MLRSVAGANVSDWCRGQLLVQRSVAPLVLRSVTGAEVSYWCRGQRLVLRFVAGSEISGRC